MGPEEADGPRPIPDDGGGNLECYNDELATYDDEDKRWFTMNWLFAECYLSVGLLTPACPELTGHRYRLLRSYFASTQHWKNYDPFFDSKAETYKSSSNAIVRKSTACTSAKRSGS